MNRKKDEPVLVERRRYGFWPEVFVWRGQRYDARHLERWWTLAHGAGTRRLERRYFRVRCDGDIFEIYHDLLANTWGLSAAAGPPQPDLNRG